MHEYRKFKSGKEYMKLREGQLTSILNMEQSARILITTNAHMIQDFHNEDLSVPCDEQEYNDAKTAVLLRIS